MPAYGAQYPDKLGAGVGKIEGLLDGPLGATVGPAVGALTNILSRSAKLMLPKPKRSKMDRQ